MANSCNYDPSAAHLGENLSEDNALEIEQPRGTSRPSVSLDTVSRTRAAHDTEDCINRIPKNTLTFLAQIVVVYGIISVSLYHLSAQSPNQELWLVLLSSAFVYILPSPGLKYQKRSRVASDGSLAGSTSGLDRDFVDGYAEEEKAQGSFKVATEGKYPA